MLSSKRHSEGLQALPWPYGVASRHIERRGKDSSQELCAQTTKVDVIYVLRSVVKSRVWYYINLIQPKTIGEN